MQQLENKQRIDAKHEAMKIKSDNFTTNNREKSQYCK